MALETHPQDTTILQLAEVLASKSNQVFVPMYLGPATTSKVTLWQFQVSLQLERLPSHLRGAGTRGVDNSQPGSRHVWERVCRIAC